jgi:hypothetical protein
MTGVKHNNPPGWLENIKAVRKDQWKRNEYPQSAKDKLSLIKTGGKMSKEAVDASRKGLLKYYETHSPWNKGIGIRVMRVEDQKIYNSITEASKDNNCRRPLIANACREGHEHYTAKNYHWKFLT